MMLHDKGGSTVRVRQRALSIEEPPANGLVFVAFSDTAEHLSVREGLYGESRRRGAETASTSASRVALVGRLDRRISGDRFWGHVGATSGLIQEARRASPQGRRSSFAAWSGRGRTRSGGGPGARPLWSQQLLSGGRLVPTGAALRKNLWCFGDDRIAVRFQYESRDRDGRGGAAMATSSGIRRARTHAPARGEHQRPAD